ncbi:MAG: energy-coupled thiamine transporter ThiT [Clostridia bacterium]|nr:energy-coupled thiamine transporter ThiT [Clostridia bacterium]
MFKNLYAKSAKAIMLALVLAIAFAAVCFSVRPAALAESAVSGNDDTETVGSAPTDEPKEGESASGDVMTVGASETDTESDSDDEDAAKKHSIVLAVIGGAIAACFVALIVFVNFGKKGVSNQRITSIQLTESALMVAVATVCSLIKIDLPYGGGVTIVSMLPLVIISHRYGWRWGITTAFVYSIIQMILGLDNVGYATSTAMAFGVIFLDYIVAYTVIGLAGAFGKGRNGVAIGIIITFFLRFVCHYTTGVWIWKEWMPEEFFGLTMTSPWIYSLLYNGWYMLVELVITLVVAMLIYRPLKGYFENREVKTN